MYWKKNFWANIRHQTASRGDALRFVCAHWGPGTTVAVSYLQVSSATCFFVAGGSLGPKLCEDPFFQNNKLQVDELLGLCFFSSVLIDLRFK